MSKSALTVQRKSEGTAKSQLESSLKMAEIQLQDAKRLMKYENLI